MVRPQVSQHLNLMEMEIILMAMETKKTNHNGNSGLPAYSHQSYSHLVGIWVNDEEWEYDTVIFPPCIIPSSINR